MGKKKSDIANDSSVEARSRKNWHKDAAEEGMPSSSQVVVEWLRSPGNAAKWRQALTKKDLIKEIQAALHYHQITYRSNASVKHRVNFLEKQYKAAEAWLQEAGMLDAITDGTADDEIVKSVQKQYPHFLELRNVFGSDVLENEKLNKSVDMEEEEDAGSEDADMLESEPVQTNGKAKSKKKKSSVKKAASGTKDVSVLEKKKVETKPKAKTKRKKSIEEVAALGSENDFDFAGVPATTKEEEHSFLTPSASKESKKKARTESDKTMNGSKKKKKTKAKETPATIVKPAKPETVAEKTMPLSDIPMEYDEKKVKEEHEQALFELRRDILLEEMKTKRISKVCETALARKKMLDAGISQQQVDVILPMGPAALDI